MLEIMLALDALGRVCLAREMGWSLVESCKWGSIFVQTMLIQIRLVYTWMARWCLDGLIELLGLVWLCREWQMRPNLNYDLNWWYWFMEPSQIFLVVYVRLGRWNRSARWRQWIQLGIFQEQRYLVSWMACSPAQIPKNPWCSNKY